MSEKLPQPSELDRLQEWARVGMSLYVAATAVIAMRYPETAIAALKATPPQGDAT